MNERPFFPMLMVAIVLQVLAPHAAFADETTVQVVATGTGVDAGKALKSAFSNAIQQAVGLVVDAETIVKNDQVIRDQILNNSNAYIEKYDIVSQGKNPDGLVEVKIKATVRRQQLVEKLVEARVVTNKEPAVPSAPAEAAAGAPSSAPPKSEEEIFTIHGQTTVITQKHDEFHAPYSGPNSPQSEEVSKTTVTATLFAGLRLPWPGGAVYFNPELAGGESFSNVTGIAGWPNGESLPSQLVEQRPDVRQAEENLHSACAQIGIAVANRLPNFMLSADAGAMALTPGQMFTRGAEFWTLGAGVTQPIFQGGALLHKERAARAAYLQAAEQYRSTVLTAFQNVADALTALQQDADALKAAAAAEGAAKVTLDLARQQMQAGYAGYLALLT